MLPVSQQSIFVLSSLAYHDYEGVALLEGEKPRLVRDLGDKAFFMLRNHGLLATGRNVAEAFSFTYHFERSAEAQLKIQAAVASGAKMVFPPKETCERQAAQFATQGNTVRLGGQREWPALLRLCDRLDPGFRT